MTRCLTPKIKDKMDNIRLAISYSECVIIVGLALGFFSLFSKKYKRFGSLLPFIFIPVWLIIGIVKGMEYMYFDNSPKLFSLLGFIGLLAETLPLLILVGGITFSIKYLKFRKSKL